MMTPERYDKLRGAYLAVATAAPEMRAEALKRACGDDDELRREVEKLLQQSGDSFLEAPALKGLTDLLSPASTPADTPSSSGADADTRMSHAAPPPDRRIGPYRLLQPIGEGGFGTVYLAEQDKPMRRRVALKIIKLGMDTRQVVARFEAERQALALMDHPNIAKVFDGGATDTGRPYFVMEYVPGEPVTKFCDSQGLTIADRLELFVQVCAAVQHAHQKGIIHRDIKPSNVLVTRSDAAAPPLIKVIDFGVAKATAMRLTERTVFTEQGQFIGTPQYMSPEQAAGSADIDTRTDVYALGVLLYELLTGMTPFDPKQLRSAAYGELQRIIREVEPPKPSTRLSSATDSLPSIAAQRKIEPKRLGTVIRGDLDWIVMKALEKAPDRRYSTADVLALDVKRHLAGEAVLAAPPSAGYRVRKFIRRHRGRFIAACVMVALLVIGTAGTSVGFLRARQSESSARSAADQARQTADFVAQTLSGVRPGVACGQDTALLRGMMDDALKRIERGELGTAPESEVYLRRWIGDTYAELGAVSDSERVLSQALSLARQVYPPDHLEVIRTLESMGRLDIRMGQAEAGLTTYREALALLERARAGETELILQAHAGAGDALVDLGRPSEALVEYDAALRLADPLYPDPHAERAFLLESYANCLGGLGRDEEALPLLQRAKQTREALGLTDHPDYADGLHDLACSLLNVGRREEALQAFKDAYALLERLYPPDHPTKVQCLASTGTCLIVMGRGEEAIPYMRSALDMTRRLVPENDAEIGRRAEDMASALSWSHQWTQAITVYPDAVEALRRAFPQGHPRLSHAIVGWADAYAWLGRYAEALPLYVEGIAMFRSQDLGKTEMLPAALCDYGVCLRKVGRHADAIAPLQEAVDLRQQYGLDDDANIYKPLKHLGQCLCWVDRSTEAEPLLMRALDIASSATPSDTREIADAQFQIGVCDAKLEKWNDALAHLQTASGLFHQFAPDGDYWTRLSDLTTSQALLALERFEEANALASSTAAGLRQGQLPSDTGQLSTALTVSGAALMALKRPAEAEPLVLESMTLRERVLGADDWRRAESRSLLGAVRTQLKAYKDAEPLLLDAYDALHGNARAPKTALRKAIDRIVTLYETWSSDDASLPSQDRSPPGALEKWKKQKDALSRENSTP